MSNSIPTQTKLYSNNPLDTLYSVTCALFAIAELTDPLYASESAAQRFGALALLLAHRLDDVYNSVSTALEAHDTPDEQDAAQA